MAIAVGIATYAPNFEIGLLFFGRVKIKWIVIIAVLAGIWFSGLGPKWLRWLMRKKDQTVQTVQQKAQEGVQKDSNRRKATNDFYDSVADPNR